MASSRALRAAVAAAVVTPTKPLSTEQPAPARPSMDPAGEPPRRLSCRIGHKDYHPSFARVGVLVNGIEVKNLEWYDQDNRVIQTVTSKAVHQVESIEAFWRYTETRQQRRARERWERNK
jgi:hypothetical protein